MKRAGLFLSMLVLVLFSLVCQKQERDLEAEKAAINRLIANDTIWFNANTQVDSTDTTKFYTTSKLDTWLIWWRGQQTHSQPIIDINIIKDSAFVSWRRGNFGNLYSLIKPPDTTWLLWTKLVSETVRVNAIFKQTGNTHDTLTYGWQLKKISLASGHSDSLHTIRIDSLRIQSSSNPNMVIVNPLNTFFRIDSLLGFNPSEVVSLTVYTNADYGEAFLHTFILAWPFYVRLKFNRVGNGVFYGSWPAQRIKCPRFAIFDIIDHATLYAETTKYNACGWFLPYRIK